MGVIHKRRGIYIYTVRTILIYDIVQYSGIYCDGKMSGTMEMRLIDSTH